MKITSGDKPQESFDSLRADINHRLREGVKASRTVLDTYPRLKPSELVDLLLAYGEARRSEEILRGDLWAVLSRVLARDEVSEEAAVERAEVAHKEATERLAQCVEQLRVALRHDTVTATEENGRVVVKQGSVMETIDMKPDSVRVDSDGTVVLRGISTRRRFGSASCSVIHEVTYHPDGTVTYHSDVSRATT